MRERVRIAAEDVDLAQIDPEELRQKLGKDDAAERAFSSKGMG